MNLGPVCDLSVRWRDEAESLRRRGLEREATMVESFAADLEETVARWWTQPLGLAEAAEEAGLTYRAMQKRVEREQVPNAGRKGSPKVRRCDLYNGVGPKLETGEPDLAGEVLVSRRTGA